MTLDTRGVQPALRRSTAQGRWSSSPAPARLATALLATALSCCAATAAAAPMQGDARSAAVFARWSAPHAAEVDAYRAFLAQRELADVVPTHELLRTASAWNDAACRAAGAEPFEVPPRALWPAMARTLRLVAHLRRERLLGAFEVVSAYRNPTVNGCAGSTGNRHPRNAALDLVPRGRDTSTAATVAALCAFHGAHGAAWGMGLSLYPSGRIHIDADGHRTWGHDGRRGTSACLQTPRGP